MIENVKIAKLLSALLILILLDIFYDKVLLPNTKPRTAVETVFDTLTSEPTRVSEPQFSNIKTSSFDYAEWIRVEKNFFNLHLPKQFTPRFRDVHIVFHDTSLITCGEVAFSDPGEWHRFISSRRSTTSIYKGGNNLGDDEFDQLYRKACQPKVYSSQGGSFFDSLFLFFSTR